jgi:hypothetical protein
MVQYKGPPVVSLLSPGAVRGVGVVIGSPDYEDQGGERRKSWMIYPGVYVWEAY